MFNSLLYFDDFMDKCKNIVNEYAPRFPQDPWAFKLATATLEVLDSVTHSPTIEQSIPSWCKVVSKELDQNLPVFNQHHIRNFIVKYMDQISPSLESDYIDKKDLDWQRSVYGYFTGCLVDVLTSRNQENGKETLVYVDGKGSTFDYLFAGTNNFDQVIIEDFCGNHIGRLMASYGGKGDTVMFKGIKGANTGSYIGQMKGRVRNIIFAGCEGKNNAVNTGIQGGKIGNLILLSQKGKSAGFISGWKGTTGRMMAVSCNSDELFGHCIQRTGSLDEVIIIDCKGDDILADTATKRDGTSTIDSIYLCQSETKYSGFSSYRQVGCERDKGPNISKVVYDHFIMEFWRPIATNNNTFWKSGPRIPAGIDESNPGFKLNNGYLEPGIEFIEGTAAKRICENLRKKYSVAKMIRLAKKSGRIKPAKTLQKLKEMDLISSQ